MVLTVLFSALLKQSFLADNPLLCVPVLYKFNYLVRVVTNSHKVEVFVRSEKSPLLFAIPYIISFYLLLFHDWVYISRIIAVGFHVYVLLWFAYEPTVRPYPDRPYISGEAHSSHSIQL